MRSYDETVEGMLCFLTQKHVCKSSIDSHKKCYQRYRTFLSEQNKPWESRTVSEWIIRLRQYENRQLCSAWFLYMKQLAEFHDTGTILDRHLYLTRSAYDRLEDTMRAELDDYLASCRDHYSERSWELARKYLSGMLLFFEDCGRKSVAEIAYSDVISYYHSHFCSSEKNRAIYLGHARRFFEFMSNREKCPVGYSIYLDDNNAPYVGSLNILNEDLKKQISSVSEESQEFPSEEFLAAINGFIDSLTSHHYGVTSVKTAQHALKVFFLFLDIHGLGYHPDIAAAWFSGVQADLPKNWKHWRRLIFLFTEYAEYGDIIPSGKYTYQSTSFNSLPEWCRSRIEDYASLLGKEFHAPGTIRSYKYPCIRLCRYLADKGCSGFSELTADILQDFCSQEYHRSFYSRSSSLSIIRRFIIFLEECDVIKNPHLHLCINSGCAPSEKIIDILSVEQCRVIEQYRSSCTTPMELRRIAMVMIGIKMGLRASDVVNLKLSDIDWKNRSITIIQEKTKTSLKLPVPISVGNALYKYIKYGRPRIDSEFVFIRHRAPYGRLTNKTCTIALWSILPERKAATGGFHVTRRTFASNVLRTGAGVDRVMDTLGHTDPSSVMKYLSMDEEKMRECPLSLSDLHLDRGEAEI